MRDKNKFKNDLKSILNSSYKETMISNFDDIVNEDDSVETIADKMSTHSAKVFSESLAPILAKVIDDYIDSLVIDNKLVKTSNGGTLTGIAKIMK